MKDWQRFVLAHGWRARVHELAAVLGRPAAEIIRVRSTGACTKLGSVKRFAELFALWHGRPPRDDEWPAPRNAGGRRAYEWQAPEDALLASLVGRLDKHAIAKVLTKRLRERTADARAARTPVAVLVNMHRIGMQAADVVGGITIAEAGRETGAYYIVWNAIQRKHLRAFRVGRVWVIPHAAWKAWKASRVFPPKGFVQLTTLKRPLGIRSDKLSEWARLGYVPSAVRCNPYGTRARSTQFGTWFLDSKVARRLIADRRAGRPMPWWNKPEPCNLRVTWKLLQERRHPAACRTCAQIWGRKGAPHSYDDYAVRYPPLTHGAKRHLTRPWSPGLTPAQVASDCGRSVSAVMRAIKNDVLEAERMGHRFFVSRTEATRWKARRCPLGGSYRSWLSLEFAGKLYCFKRSELRALIRKGTLRSKVGTNGPMRGITYVLRHQCRLLREKIGFTEKQAARRARVTVPRLRILLKGVYLRGAERIPLPALQTVIKRIESREGYTLDEAAAALGMRVEWVHARILDGTVRIARAKWDRRRKYVTKEMLERLRKAERRPVKREKFGAAWLYASQVAKEAGVSVSMVGLWADAGELRRRPSHLGWRYHRTAVRARARRYWKTVRFRRAVPPAWLQQERGQRAANEDRYLQAA